MSARDLAAFVRSEMTKLPQAEQSRFLALVTTTQPTQAVKAKVKKMVVWEDRSARLREIFGDKVLEKNIVLEERETYEY